MAIDSETNLRPATGASGPPSGCRERIRLDGTRRPSPILGLSIRSLSYFALNNPIPRDGQPWRRAPGRDCYLAQRCRRLPPGCRSAPRE